MCPHGRIQQSDHPTGFPYLFSPHLIASFAMWSLTRYRCVFVAASFLGVSLSAIQEVLKEAQVEIHENRRISLVHLVYSQE